MTSEETIELSDLNDTVGKRSDLPEQNPRSTLMSSIRSLQLRNQGTPNLIYLYGAYDQNETLTFDVGDDYIYCMFCDGAFLYCGLMSNPAKVVKIDLDTFTVYQTITFDTGENEIHSMFSDGFYLYCGLGTIPGKVVRVDLNSFTKVDTLTFAVGENNITSIFSDGNYLYCGLLVGPGKIARIDLDSFTQVDTLTFAVGENSVNSMFCDGNFLYVGLLTTPGKIVKVDLDSFTSSQTLTLDVGENEITQMFYDGSYLYVGSSTSPAKLVKINLDTFTKVSTITFDAGENNIRAFASDGTYLYCGLYLIAPGKIVKVDLSKFVKVNTTTFDVGEERLFSLFCDGSYLYSGMRTVPGQVKRSYVIPTSELRGRQIESIDERVKQIMKPSVTTIDLNQVAGTYDLFTGKTAAVIVDSLIIRMPDGDAGGALTSISIQTNDTTPIVFISSTLGAVANLTAQAQLATTTPILIAVGQKIQLTIAGGAHGLAYECTIVAIIKAITNGGYLG